MFVFGGNVKKTAELKSPILREWTLLAICTCTYLLFATSFFLSISEKCSYMYIHVRDCSCTCTCIHYACKLK